MSVQEQALFSDPLLLAAFAALLMVEFGLMIWAVVDWARRPADQLRGNRMLWLILIVLVNIVGPIVYLTVARKPQPALDPLADGSSASRARDAASALYGPGEDSGLPNG